MIDFLVGVDERVAQPGQAEDADDGVRPAWQVFVFTISPSALVTRSITAATPSIDDPIAIGMLSGSRLRRPRRGRRAAAPGTARQHDDRHDAEQEKHRADPRPTRRQRAPSTRVGHGGASALGARGDRARRHGQPPAPRIALVAPAAATAPPAAARAGSRSGIGSTSPLASLRWYSGPRRAPRRRASARTPRRSRRSASPARRSPGSAARRCPRARGSRSSPPSPPRRGWR